MDAPSTRLDCILTRSSSSALRRSSTPAFTTSPAPPPREDTARASARVVSVHLTASAAPDLLLTRTASCAPPTPRRRLGTAATALCSTSQTEGAGITNRRSLALTRERRTIGRLIIFHSQSAPTPTTPVWMNCPGASAPQQPTNPSAPQLPASFGGDIVMGPCTGPNGTIPSIRLNYSVQGTDAVTKAIVNYHGMLMWDDRANNDVNGQPSLNGGGGLLIAGNLYFHNCPEAPSECAAPPTDYNATFSLGGNSGSSTYIFGNITSDELVQTGGGTITMELNPNLMTNILKVALLQ